MRKCAIRDTRYFAQACSTPQEAKQDLQFRRQWSRMSRTAQSHYLPGLTLCQKDVPVLVSARGDVALLQRPLLGFFCAMPASRSSAVSIRRWKRNA